MIWYTWLGFFGLALGIAGSGLLGWSPLKAAAAGLAAGIAAVLVVNAALPAPPCLQSAKGLDILRAYMICK